MRRRERTYAPSALRPRGICRGSVRPDLSTDAEPCRSNQIGQRGTVDIGGKRPCNGTTCQHEGLLKFGKSIDIGMLLATPTTGRHSARLA